MHPLLPRLTAVTGEMSILLAVVAADLLDVEGALTLVLLGYLLGSHGHPQA
jgi:hypothetical protein